MDLVQGYRLSWLIPQEKDVCGLQISGQGERCWCARCSGARPQATRMKRKRCITRVVEYCLDTTKCTELQALMRLRHDVVGLDNF
eukprot:4953804-Amphidinium_carterae.1